MKACILSQAEAEAVDWWLLITITNTLSEQRGMLETGLRTAGWKGTLQARIGRPTLYVVKLD